MLCRPAIDKMESVLIKPFMLHTEMESVLNETIHTIDEVKSVFN